MKIVVLKMGENRHTNLSYQVYTIRMSILLGILKLAWPILIKDIYFGLFLTASKRKTFKKNNIIN